MKRQGRGPSRRERKKAEQERPAPHNCDDHQRLTKVVRLLLDRAAGGHQQILIGQVLEVAIPGYTDPVHDDPLADPLTGAKWPGPPGSEPPV